jgi:integrase/recombinase XerD
MALRGLSPETVVLYSHGVRRAAGYFGFEMDNLSREQLTEYLSWLLAKWSWSTLKHDLYGLQFYYQHVLGKPWPGTGLVKPPKTSRLPNIVTVAQMRRIVASTRVLSYRMFFFTLYSMGLRLGEGLRLRVEDIDADRMQVHIRNAKGNRDRLVPLPVNTLNDLRRFWAVHRHPDLLFPSRRNWLMVIFLCSHQISFKCTEDGGA